jgi:hypothetical protein
VDDGRAQVTLGAVVGGLDVVTMQEDVEAIAVRAVAFSISSRRRANVSGVICSRS